MMQQTLLSLIAFAILAIQSVAWPQSVQEFSVLGEDSVSGGGTSYHGLQSGFALRSTGNPTFIASKAYAYGNSYLARKNLPYLLVLKHDPDSSFNFKSVMSDSKVTTTFSVNGTKIILRHSLRVTQNDNSKPPTITESLDIDGKPIDLENGRLITMEIKNGTAHLTQTKVSEIPTKTFYVETDSARERISPVLRWWKEQQKMSRKHEIQAG